MSFPGNDISITVTLIFAKIVGLWLAADRFEQRIRTVTLIYTLSAILFAVWIQIRDFYYSWGDFSVSDSVQLKSHLIYLFIAVGNYDKCCAQV